MRRLIRPPVAGRRRPPRRRLWALFNWTRGLGALLVVLSAAGLYWAINTPLFRLDPERLQFHGLVHTGAEEARLTMGLAPGAQPHLFRLRTSIMERALADLPAVARAEVSAVLPDELEVRITERQPVFVLATPAGSFLVDAAGVLLTAAAADDQTAAGLPVVADERRDLSRDPVVGGAIEGIDLQAILQLAAVTPELLASGAGALRLAITDSDGYVMTTEPASWRAVFGHYTPTLRPPDIIAQQVQCLRSLFGEGEAGLRTVYLEPVADRCGTFDAGPTPARATPSPEPSASARM